MIEVVPYEKINLENRGNVTHASADEEGDRSALYHGCEMTFLKFYVAETSTGL